MYVFVENEKNYPCYTLLVSEVLLHVSSFDFSQQKASHQTVFFSILSHTYYTKLQIRVSIEDNSKIIF